MAVTYYLALNDGPFGNLRIMIGLIGTIITSFCIDAALRRSSIEHRWHALSTLSFAVAYAIWNLTNAGRFSGPDAWFQGHGVWHVLTGVSLGCMAVLYRSEIETPLRAPDAVPVGNTLPSKLDAAADC